MPAPIPGKVQFFSMYYCPFAHRSWLVLEHKQIPYNPIFMLLRKDLPDWARERNPNGMVPIIEHEGKVVYESLVVSQYLDDVFPKNKLTPTDPYVRARHDILVSEFSKVSSPYFNLSFKDDVDVNEEFGKLLNGLEIFEKELSGDYFGGANPSLLDFNIWPFFERFPAMKPGANLEIPRDRFPKITSWIDRMYQLPAVKACLVDTESHDHFLRTFAAQKPDYGYKLRSL